MKLLDGKSIVLGIGIGIILTALISMIFLMGVKPEKLGENEIKQLAKQYGMVDADNYFYNGNQLKPEDMISESDPPEIISDKIFKAGLIKDKETFLNKLKN